MRASLERTEPYTEAGLVRLSCSIDGCSEPAQEQWRVRSCEIGGPDTWRAVCAKHDRRLNRFLIRLFFNIEADTHVTG